MKYDAEKLKLFTYQIMQKVGLNKEDSELFAESLIRADMRGMSSHGVTRLKTYSYRLEAGLVDANAKIEVVSDAPSMLLIDGHNGLGVPTAMKAMKLCVERAKQTGACFAAVKGGNHFGVGEYFSDYAANQNMIGVAMANGPVALAPIGGREAVLGTNPLSVSIPSGKYGCINLDMATSMVARGKVALAAKEGRSIPEGWGIDADGHPTTDPNAVKCMIPFGGPKGFAICLIIEILSSCLSGAATGQTMGSFYDFSGKIQNSGFFLGAMDVGKIMDVDTFKKNVDDLSDSIKNSPKAEGCEEIFLPGEIEQRKTLAAEKDGISISDAVLNELREISEKYGVPFSCELQ